MRRIFKKVVGQLIDPRSVLLERILLNQGKLFSKLPTKYNIHNLSEVEFCCFSQWGEDGILDWLISCLGDLPKTFIEFGVENYRESNTRFLVLNRNWSGLVIDGSDKNISNVKKQKIYWRHSIEAVCSFITKENINSLISDAGHSGETGLLSIDIDGMDYWIWDAIDIIDPVIVVVEYNSIFGDLHSITAPYRHDFQRSKAHFSNLFFGASIKALKLLGEKKGYRLVGTNSNGCNAFFVRNDLAGRILDRLDGVWIFPASFRESRDKSGSLNFLKVSARTKVINHLKVFSLDANQEVRLEDMNPLRSADFECGKEVLI